MKGRLIVVGTDGSLTVTELTAPPDYETINEAVGGYIEIVPGFNRFGNCECVAFCNEEGKLERMNEEGKLESMFLNIIAQALWERSVGFKINDDYLVGPVAIIVGDEELLREL
jgi:hypothetical protein